MIILYNLSIFSLYIDGFPAEVNARKHGVKTDLPTKTILMVFTGNLVFTSFFKLNLRLFKTIVRPSI